MHSLIMVLVGLAHGGLIFVETLDIGLTRSMDPVIAALHESSRPGAGEIGVQAPVQNYELTGTQSAGIDPELNGLKTAANEIGRLVGEGLQTAKTVLGGAGSAASSDRVVHGLCAPSDVVLVLDASESILESDWKKFVKFTHDIVASLPISDDEMNLGIVEFGSDAKNVCGLKSDKAALKKAIDSKLSKETSGRTMTHLAIRMATKELQENGRDDKQQLIFMLTDGLPTERNETGAAFAEAKKAGMLVQIVTIGFLASYLPPPAEWYTAGHPPLKFSMGYSELVDHLTTVTGAICKLSNAKQTPVPVSALDTTFSPIESESTPAPESESESEPTPTPESESESTTAPESESESESTPAPESARTTAPFSTFPPKAEDKPCTPWGHLHMDFGGDVSRFGDVEQAELTKMLKTALNIKTGELMATRHTDADEYLNTGALGHGKIYHPTKVQLNFKFEGTESIEHGRELEKQVSAGTFVPLPAFPLLRLEMEEIYCTPAPTGAPTAEPTVPTTETPTEHPTTIPTTVPTFGPTEVATPVPALKFTTTQNPTQPTTFAPRPPPSTAPTSKPTAEPTATPTAVPTVMPTAEPTAEPSDEPTLDPSFPPTVEPTSTPTEEPTQEETEAPSHEPTITEEPTDHPVTHAVSRAPTHETSAPTDIPTDEPTADPTEAPTFDPTNEPTADPTEEPSEVPTAEPTAEPTDELTEEPTAEPTAEPTTLEPTADPTATPTQVPTVLPTVQTTVVPSNEPTIGPTIVPSEYPTDTPTDTPTVEPTLEPTANPTEVPTHEPTSTPTEEPSNEPTAGPATDEPSSTPTHPPTESPTAAPSVTPTEKPSPHPTAGPTVLPSAVPTDTPTEKPTIEPTDDPTAEPSIEPTVEPTAEPTDEPSSGEPTTLDPTTDEPTHTPTHKPSFEQTDEPATDEPTTEPTATPTEEPSTTPTTDPTAEPTVEPTKTPSHLPTVLPTEEPTGGPSDEPTEEPTAVPTAEPSDGPTGEPSIVPSEGPSAEPTEVPTVEPSAEPTLGPTGEPSDEPTTGPSAEPTTEPTAEPTEEPTAEPTVEPTIVPTGEPSSEPSDGPTVEPTEEPSKTPSEDPTEAPTTEPTEEPTDRPTVTPTESPTAVPTAVPTEVPTTLPPTTDEPSFDPTHTPTEEPTEEPTATPTEEPSDEPTAVPTEEPTNVPSATPTDEPTAVPTLQPTAKPSLQPTTEPTLTPTLQPTSKPTPAPTNEPTYMPSITPTEEPTTLTPTIAEQEEKPTEEPTTTPTEEPTALPTTTPTNPPTAEPIIDPTIDPTQEPTDVPTAKPSAAPTDIPTAEPTFAPTLTPTEDPSRAPTPLPSFTPTAAPTDLPTFAPTLAPSGCLVRAAKMHILFKDNSVVVSRRLLVVMRIEAFKVHDAELKAAVAKQLNLPVSKLAGKSYRQGTNTWHTELMFKGLEAIALGRKLEKAVLANTFHPIPEYPIHRLYMEEIFDCGEHAIGATHQYDGTNGNGAQFTLPDSGWENNEPAEGVATLAPTGVAIGQPCIEGHCEDKSQCPRCSGDLVCKVDESMMFAGSKRGVCSHGGKKELLEGEQCCDYPGNMPNKYCTTTCGKGLVCVFEGQEKGPPLCSQTISPSKLTDTEPTEPPMNPTGKPQEGTRCKDQCGKNGPCSWCGSRGYCCKHSGWGAEGQGGCWNTAFNHDHHVCQFKPVSTVSPSELTDTEPTEPPMNPTGKPQEGTRCKDQCGKNGPCSWCGPRGYCCKHSGWGAEGQGGCWNTAFNHDHHVCQFKPEEPPTTPLPALLPTLPPTLPPKVLAPPYQFKCYHDYLECDHTWFPSILDRGFTLNGNTQRLDCGTPYGRYGGFHGFSHRRALMAGSPAECQHAVGVMNEWQVGKFKCSQWLTVVERYGKTYLDRQARYITMDQCSYGVQFFNSNSTWPPTPVPTTSPTPVPTAGKLTEDVTSSPDAVIEQ